MVITYHGGHFVRITQGDLTIAVNPFSKDSSFKPLRFGSDLVLISANDPDMNGVENMSFGSREPFVINGPGEYEVQGVEVSGFLAHKPYGSKGAMSLLNTIYSVHLEGIHLCFLGGLGDAELSAPLYESIGRPDILFVPIGSGEVLTPSDAEKLATRLDARVIIPVFYDDKHLAVFKKECAAEGTVGLDKYVVKAKDVSDKEGEVVILDVALK